MQQTRALSKRRRNRFRVCGLEHPDFYIYDSLPGAGEALARSVGVSWATTGALSLAGHLASLAGTAPVTEESGKWRKVRFRQAQTKSSARLFRIRAKASSSRSLQFQGYFAQAKERGHLHLGSSQHSPTAGWLSLGLSKNWPAFMTKSSICNGSKLAKCSRC
ncbi:MAG: transposase [Caldilineaceae bacterium]|nr:transposase [Caldilineaceae bacterium]